MSSAAGAFDYQSDRHCAKTESAEDVDAESLITSQIDTAPKPPLRLARLRLRLITSQIDTAPKQELGAFFSLGSLITSQIDTAPKRALCATKTTLV